MWELRQSWENTPTLHTLLKIDEAKRSEGGGDAERAARAAAQTWFAGDVGADENDIVFLPCTKYGHGCEGEIGGSCSSGSPFVHIRAPPLSCSVRQGCTHSALGSGTQNLLQA